MPACLHLADWQVAFLITGGLLETDVKVCDHHKSDGAAEVANAVFSHPGLVDEIKAKLEPWGLELPAKGNITMRFILLTSIPVIKA